MTTDVAAIVQGWSSCGAATETRRGGVSMEVVKARPVVSQLGSAMPLAVGFRETASTVRLSSPLMAELAERAASDDGLLDLAKSIAPGQVPSLLLFVAAFLLGKYPGEPLRAYFPNFTDDPLSPGEAFPAFREFCLRRADEMRELLGSRTLQMTVAERSAVLLFALDHVRKAIGGPIHLVEVGCSAGLLLQFDRYRFDFGPHGQLGDPASPVLVRTDVRGPGSWFPTTIPDVGHRIGIDLKLADPTDPDALEWIRACIFPEWKDVRSNIGKAVELLAAAPFELLEGDALRLLPAAAARTPDPLCIYHSYCLYQWPDEAREAFEALLLELSTTRVIHRVSIENVSRGPGEIVHQEFRDGRLVGGTYLGRCDLFGRWIEVAV
jgi:hypothetical protein